MTSKDFIDMVTHQTVVDLVVHTNDNGAASEMVFTIGFGPSASDRRVRVSVEANPYGELEFHCLAGDA